MIGYITLGTNDMPRACEFYDQLLAELGATRMMEEENFVAWSSPNPGAAISVSKPWNGEAASVGNGVMAAIGVETKEQVDQIYAKALELGATDEGAAGPRGDNFYAGYFRDMDGNKLNVFVMG